MLLALLWIGQVGVGAVRGERHVPASSSLNRVGASRGVSGGVSTPLSCVLDSTLLGGVASVVTAGVAGSAVAGTGAGPPKK